MFQYKNLLLYSGYEIIAEASRSPVQLPFVAVLCVLWKGCSVFQVKVT
jgi:hypothetical protein